jgi:hypothetical protein
MSEQTAEQTGRQSRTGRAAERAAAEQAAREQAAMGDGEQPTGDGEQAAPELTDEQKAELAEIAKVKGFTRTEEGEFRTSTTPIRNRKPLQLAMDEVAKQAYADWTEADRPTTWSRMPVITYFLDPDEVSKYRTLIRKACEIVTPTSYEKDGKTVEPSGVRVRYGTEFVLTEKMAAKIGKPEQTGKTVLAWAAIDKRNNPAASTNTNGDN